MLLTRRNKHLQSGWNLFDFIIVSVSLLSLGTDLGSATALRSVRLLRAFRVLRLFGRSGCISVCMYFR